MRAVGAGGGRGSARTACAAVVALVCAAAPADADSRVLEGIAYADASAGGDAEAADDARTLDLFLPDATDAPLLVFVHDRFWGPGAKSHDVARRFARPLQRAGAAVAIVRHRPAPDHPHPAAAEDVAAALDLLLERADAHGYDAGRLYVSGHGSGAQLAALLALDPTWLEARGRSRDAIRGVATWSGIYDLDPPEDTASAEQRALYAGVFGDAEARREASPLQHARGDAPPFLLMVAQQDLPGAWQGAKAFAEALRAAGHPAAEAFLLGGRDHWSALDLTGEANPARRHLLAMLELDERFGTLEALFETRRFWRDPTFSTRGFWTDAEHVVEREPDERFLRTANLLFAEPGRPPPLRPARYHAIDLAGHLARHARGSGDFLTVTNVRDEQVVWRLSEIAPYDPVIVVGLDDERELFRITDVYHTRRRYTWKQEEPDPWVLARPLGAFVHFLKAPPPHLEPRLFGRFGLEPDAFQLSEADPLASLRSLPPEQEALLTEELRCVSCHRFRGVGGRAGHLRARDGALVGGFGLALTEYPPEVWRRYCFEQVAVADEIGATPVVLGDDARMLFELVEAERGR